MRRSAAGTRRRVAEDGDQTKRRHDAATNDDLFHVDFLARPHRFAKSV
jgi:hypothetical protein